MIRPARPDDCSTLTALARRSKAHWGYDESFMRAHQHSLLVDVDYIADNPTYLAEDKGVVLGFYALEHVVDDLVELGFMFVDPTHMGRGVGRTLLRHASEVARRRGYVEMRIVSDPHATGFYEQMGAQPWGEWHSPIVPGRRLPVLHLACR